MTPKCNLCIVKQLNCVTVPFFRFSQSVGTLHRCNVLGQIFWLGLGTNVWVTTENLTVLSRLLGEQIHFYCQFTLSCYMIASFLMILFELAIKCIAIKHWVACFYCVHVDIKIDKNLWDQNSEQNSTSV